MAQEANPLRVTPDGTQLAEPPSFAPVSQEDAAEVDSERIVVRGFEIDPVEYPALPDVEDTRINAGKKTSFIKPEEFPSIANNNFNQVLATTPGLLVSEEPNSPIINLGYRGLDTQRSENTQVLKDGISVKNEQFGFPESHYTPVLDTIERIEFVRGGAALQFGPQPGGAVNFVTHMPVKDRPFHFIGKAVYGSFDLFTFFASLDGTSGPLGYYGFYDHREREGFREANSDYDLNAGGLKLVYDVTSDSRFILTLDIYDEEHGEPGGLRRTPAPNAVLYDVDRNASSRFFDRFRLERQAATLEYQKVFSEGSELSIKAFGGYLSRYSRRQRGGGFGTLPSGAAAQTNSIQVREVYNEGAEARFRQDYALAGSTSTFTGGLYFYHAQQDRDDRRGAAPDALDGQLRNLNTAETYNGAIFMENLFRFGRLSITPGMRLEFIDQSLEESFNIAKPLATASDFSFVPLFGLGASYVILPHVEAAAATTGKDGKEIQSPTITAITGPPLLEVYGNVSQGYRPKTYEAALPTGPGTFVNGDLKEGDSLQFDFGFRGRPLPYLTFDVSAFYFTFDDQVGTITVPDPNGPGTLSSIGNVGDARHMGIEAALELDVLSLMNGGEASPYGTLSLYGNVTFLDAEFTSGPNEGFTPTYAPDYQLKTGAIYRYKGKVKVGLIGTTVGESYADANNTFDRFIPSYSTWDLTAEVKVCGDRVGLIAGINNLFDEDFWSEIRDEGIAPAAERNYYGGVKVEF